MKKFFYKHPLIIGVLANILTLFVVLFSLNNDKYYLLLVLFIDLYINNWILSNSIVMSKLNIILMSISFYGMLLISIKYIS